MTSTQRASEDQADEPLNFKKLEYDTAIDFKTLAVSDPDFADCLTNNHGRLDFKNADHLRCLTKAILKRDFKLALHLPANRLCPPVPIRWLYVNWIQEVVASTRPDKFSNEVATIAGLDIGIGSSCIYPLLVCAAQSKWRMYGTDIDDANYHHAVHNVSINEWDDRIKLFHTTADGPLIPLETLGTNKLDFTMCNPPFFATKTEALATFAKDRQPFAACTGADVEMITPGGEVAYVRRMIEDSIKLCDQLQWCTVQLGKMSSLRVLVPMLKNEFGCSNWIVNVLQPSGQTIRWVLGWSWMIYRVPDELARHKSLIGTGLQMEPNEILLAEALKDDPRSVVEATLKALPLQIDMLRDGEGYHEKNHGTLSLFVRTNSAVWSRTARRKRQRECLEAEAVVATTKAHYTPAYTFLITISPSPVAEDGGSGFSTRVRWVKGEDRAVFESFCGILRTKIRSGTPGI